MRKRYSEIGVSATVKEFETDMKRAYSIADLAITRAGASTVMELIEEELPAILVPFPQASENHQEQNAQHFTEKSEGGLAIA